MTDIKPKSMTPEEHIQATLEYKEKWKTKSKFPICNNCFTPVMCKSAETCRLECEGKKP